jgi:hypothetical protein
VAKLLKAVADAEQPGLVILGKQAIDDDMNQTGQMLAALLGWPQAPSPPSSIGRRHGEVTREVDGGLQTVKLKLPAIVTTDLRLNEPRYASLPNIMKAKKKPIDDKTPADYGVDVTPRLKVLKTTSRRRKAGVKVKTVAELVDKLQDEAGGDLMTTLLSRRTRQRPLKDATNKALTAALGARRRSRCAGRRRGLRPPRRSRRQARRRRQGAARRRAAYATRLAEPLAALIVALAGGYDAILRRRPPAARTSCRASRRCST